MFAEILQADFRGQTALERLRGRLDTPVEMEICFREIAASVDIEIEEVKRLRSMESLRAQTAADAVASDVEWKLRLVSQFSFDVKPEWVDTAFSLWAEKPWLRDLPS